MTNVSSMKTLIQRLFIDLRRLDLMHSYSEAETGALLLSHQHPAIAQRGILTLCDSKHLTGNKKNLPLSTAWSCPALIRTHN